VSGAEAFWGGLFTVASFLSTTGFVSTDWDVARSWSGLEAPGLILMGLAVFGGGVGTTAGGVKLLRVYALFIHGKREMDRLIHPSSIGGAGPAARQLRRQGAPLAWIFFMLFAFSIALGMAAFALTGQSFENALVLTIAALSTTGPLVGVAGDTALRLDLLGDAAKLVFAAAMIIGRLETLALIALLNPDFWRS
jgi:trk system potassium uptake protein